jgi:hypothetical protein
MEILIKSTTEAMKEMLNLVKGYNTQAKAPNSDSKDKKKKREDKHNKFWDAPICKYCNKKHPSKPEDKCWELAMTQHPRNQRNAPAGAQGPN